MTFTSPLILYLRFRILIAAVVILAAAVGILVAVLKPVQFKGSIAFSVNRINQQQTAEYQYDGYYAIQAADLYSQTIVSWFLTPSVLLSMYDKAGIEPNLVSLDQFSSQFKARKYSAQNIVVSFVESDRDRAENIASAVVDVVEQQGSALNQTADQQSFFDISGSTPVIVEEHASAWLYGIVGFIAGWILAFIIVHSVDYLSQFDRHEDRR